MTTKLKIKPCACGSDPEIRDAWFYVDFPAKTTQGFQVVCPVCKTQSIIRGTKNAAIKDWNHGRLSGESTKAHIIRVLDSLRKEVKCKESKRIGW